MALENNSRTIRRARERSVAEARAYVTRGYRVRGWRESGTVNAIFTAPSGRRRAIVKRRTVRMEKRIGRQWVRAFSVELSVIDAARLLDGKKVRVKKPRANPARRRVAQSVTGELEHTANRALLRSAVGRAISCPQPDCGRIMDARRAVLLESATRAAVICAPCYDALPADIVSRFERIDGREL
ncbi:MAG: hypothetical protein CL793_07390 [Chloroflexi bacterium]|nr:hypothetical protein [Chloroflexota bacterium]